MSSPGVINSLTNSVAILVVDDQETNRHLLTRRLEKKGYRTAEAEGGQQALDMIAMGQFDLVLLDVMMPEVDGLAVLNAVRNNASMSKLPIIMVTARQDGGDVAECLALGANDYVTKPVDFQVLFARLDTQLALKQAENNLFQINQNLVQRVEARTAELLASEQRYQVLYDENPAMFFTLDAKGVIRSVNNYGAQHLGYEIKELLGRRASELCPKREAVDYQRRLMDCLRQPDEIARWELHKVCKDGELIRVRETARPVRSANGETQLLIVCEDITDAFQLSRQLSDKERYDDLTGLISRQEFEHHLERAIEMAEVNQTPSTLCYLDLDQFKVINDTCGHNAGDELLRRLADLMSGFVRKGDTLARMGGDEFSLLIENCSAKQSEQIADKLRQQIEAYEYRVGDNLFRIGVSIGLVHIAQGGKNVSEVLSAADSACYAAKEEGRNRIHAFKEDDLDMQQRYGDMRWVARLHQALAENRFLLFFQPIVPVNPDSREGAHYEVLMRMRGEDGSTIAPGLFLPAAERYFLSPKLDRWVIENVFKWLQAEPEHLRQLALCSINLSGHSLTDAEFSGFLLRQFSVSDIPPEKICFEVTETAAIANIGAATRLIDEMRSLGCCFSLDDFGSGLSSFAYLKRLPVDFLKIDGQFVKNMVDNKVDRAMVKSIHDVARVMGIRTVAEFVEDQAILDVLREIGVDYAQGYGIDHPKPFAEMTIVQG